MLGPASPGGGDNEPEVLRGRAVFVDTADRVEWIEAGEEDKSGVDVGSGDCDIVAGEETT